MGCSAGISWVHAYLCTTAQREFSRSPFELQRRLRDAFGEEIEFVEKGQPVDFASAKQLAENDKFQFQHWALSLVHARPLKEGDGKGADRGVDGVLYFYETGDAKTPGSARGSRAGSGGSPEPTEEAVARGRTTEHAGRVRSPALKTENVHREKIVRSRYPSARKPRGPLITRMALSGCTSLQLLPTVV